MSAARSPLRSAIFTRLALVAAIGWLAQNLACGQNEPEGRKLAFLVGVKNYDHEGLKDLDFPENDVEDLAAVLRQQTFQTVVLTTARGKRNPANKPTADNIRGRLKTLLRGANKRDLIVVALAGHGIQPLGSDDSYFCPMDANPIVKDDKPIEPSRLVSVGELLVQMTNSGIGEKLLLVDACRNDPSARSAKRRGVDQVNVAALPGRTGVLLSCSQGEFSFEEKTLGKGHGVFFYHVIEGLKGKAIDGKGRITWDGLGTYVRTEVPPTVQKLFGNSGAEQSPNAIGNLRGAPTVLADLRNPEKLRWDFTNGSNQGTKSAQTQIVDAKIWGHPGGSLMRFKSGGHSWMEVAFRYSPDEEPCSLQMLHLSSGAANSKPGYSPVQITLNGHKIWRGSPPENGGFGPGKMWTSTTVDVRKEVRQGRNVLRWDYLAGATTHYWLKSFQIVTAHPE